MSLSTQKHNLLRVQPTKRYNFLRGIIAKSYIFARMINRLSAINIRKDWTHEKVIVVLGPRQVGKTTLVKSLTEEYNTKTLWLNGDDPQVRAALSEASSSYLMRLIEEYDVVVIDEAQRINNIGLTAKIWVDAQLAKQIILTGSSSLNLGTRVNEPLTGRKWEHTLFPLSWKEIAEHYTFAKAQNMLDELLVFGMYPEIVTKPEKQRRLSLLAGSYLYQDILELTGIKKPELLTKLLRAIALQSGSEVSYNELSKILAVDRMTIINYIELLEKVFVIFRLYPFSRNKRNEITSKPKIYFYDNGIRNAVIGQFDPIQNRNDKGDLFENFFISEKIKQLSYSGFYGQTHYWRNKQQAEIDFLEVENDNISAYEIKYSPKQKARFSKSFTNYYHPEKTIAVNKSNFWEYLE